MDGAGRTLLALGVPSGQPLSDRWSGVPRLSPTLGVDAELGPRQGPQGLEDAAATLLSVAWQRASPSACCPFNLGG